MVYGKAQDESNRFILRSKSNDSRTSSLAQDEDVFISMLHRRARFMNPAFQAKVMDVLMLRQAKEVSMEENGGFGCAPNEQSPNCPTCSEVTLLLEPPVVGSFKVIHLSSLAKSTFNKSSFNISALSLQGLAFGESFELLDNTMDPGMVSAAELDSLPVACEPPEPTPTPALIVRSASTNFCVENL